MLCNEIGQLVSPVILSHSAKSHDFFDAHGGIYLINKKNVCTFLNLYALAFPFNIFFNAIFRNAHKNKWMET